MARIESTLAEATKVTAKDGEDRQKYLTRLVRAANDLDDAKWKALPKDVQLAVNAAVKSMNETGKIAEFADAGGEAPAAAPSTAPAAAAPAAASAPAASAPAPAGDAKPAQDKKKGGTAVFRKNVVLHPDKPMKDLIEMSATEGFPITQSTAAIIYYEARAALMLAKENGFLVPSYNIVQAPRGPRKPPTPKAKAEAPAGEAPVARERPVEAATA
jgi:hypothetical protein